MAEKRPRNFKTKGNEMIVIDKTDYEITIGIKGKKVISIYWGDMFAHCKYHPGDGDLRKQIIRILEKAIEFMQK
jgi:hypothetical protein